MSEGVNKDIHNLLDLNIAHSANSQSTDKWVGIFDILSQYTTLETISSLSLLCRQYLDEGGHRHHGHVRLASRIVDKVQVHHFLDFKDGNVHNVENIRKEGRHVVSHCHVGDDFLHHCLLALVLWIALVRVQFGP